MNKSDLGLLPYAPTVGILVKVAIPQNKMTELS
jgi:hypothetical protein